VVSIAASFDWLLLLPFACARCASYGNDIVERGLGCAFDLQFLAQGRL